MPRFSLRELLMLTTICALLVPYFYSRIFTASQIDFSWQTVTSLVAKVAPDATIQAGIGSNDFVEMTCLIPAEKSDAFFANLHAAVEKHIGDSRWTNQGVSTSSSGDSLTAFRYDLSNGSARCAVVGVLLDKKQGNDQLYNKPVDEVRFIILAPHVRSLNNFG